MVRVGKPAFRFNPEVVAGWLQHPEVLEQLHAKSAETAERVRARVPEDVEVTVTHTINENGRPADIVTIKHASGQARQMKDGVLTISAAESGLEIGRLKGGG